MSGSDIEAAVRAWARGMYASEAGVELLIRQGKAIREGAPWLEELERGDESRPRMTSVDVDVLLERTGAWSGGEQRIVRIAASLLGGPAVRLDDELAGLDRTGIELVLAAVAHANGSHEHSAWDFDAAGRPVGSHKLKTAYPWPAGHEATPRGARSATKAHDDVDGPGLSGMTLSSP